MQYVLVKEKLLIIKFDIIFGYNNLAEFYLQLYHKIVFVNMFQISLLYIFVLNTVGDYSKFKSIIVGGICSNLFHSQKLTHFSHSFKKFTIVTREKARFLNRE